ncbi:hypothetical protein FA95DRAFT_1557922 [Auriscalpium vulgare]|uniref:Uncharacterized protein n=1 Tax=Auriscalpium vulgare TaxID=40419 RepID=A0ACB8RYF2_9AGAM|nr:hypothetical protein FA95DRAFT_1557922 [Auriscalpium vulgare]
MYADYRFTSAEERAYMSPSSSPSGSPYTEPMDSSPLSSPSLEPLDIEEEFTYKTSGIPHPYAGSTNATQRPPLYSMETDRGYQYEPQNISSALGDLFEEDDVIYSLDSRSSGQSDSVTVTADDESVTWWADVLSGAVDTGLGILDLSQSNITYIPPEVAELATLGVVPQLGNHSRVLQRSQTAPAALAFNAAPHGEVKARGSALKGLQLYLYDNLISELPLELFSLQNLTVLSLRNNKLEHLPPQIVDLHALRDLNVSMNSLSSLPAEIDSMKLDKLIVHPNPFKRYSGPPLPGDASNWHPISAATIISRLPSLQEISIRYLLSPASSPPGSPIGLRTMQNTAIRRRQATDTRAPSNLEKYYMLPIPETSVPAWAVALLGPGAISRPRGSRAPSSSSLFSGTTATSERGGRNAPTIGRCPSPLHCDPSQPPLDVKDAAWVRRGPPFVTHAEERYTWTMRIAGLVVGRDNIGVPLLWRGCESGCLDFLESGEMAGVIGGEQPEPEGGLGAGASVPGGDGDVDMSD